MGNYDHLLRRDEINRLQEKVAEAAKEYIEKCRAYNRAYEHKQETMIIAQERINAWKTLESAVDALIEFENQPADLIG